MQTLVLLFPFILIEYEHLVPTEEKPVAAKVQVGNWANGDCKKRNPLATC